MSRLCRVAFCSSLLWAGPVLAETWRVGEPELQGALLQPGRQVFRGYRQAEGEKHLLNETVQEISKQTWQGENVYRISTIHASAAGDTTRGDLIVRQDDFSLVRHRVKAARDSTVVVSYGGHVTGWVVLPGQPVRLIDLNLGRRVFPVDGPRPWLVTILPLRPDFAVSIPRFSQWEARESLAEFRVLGSETIVFDGRAVDSWRVDCGPLGPPGYRAVVWVDKKNRRLLKSVLRSETSDVMYSGESVPPGQPE